MLGSALSNIYIVITMQTLTTDMTKRMVTIPGGGGMHCLSGELGIFPRRKSKELKTGKSRNRSVSVSFVNVEVNK